MKVAGPKLTSGGKPESLSGVPLMPILIFGGLLLIILGVPALFYWCDCREGAVAEEKKREKAAEIANQPKIPPPLAYQNQRKSRLSVSITVVYSITVVFLNIQNQQKTFTSEMTLFNMPPVKIIPHQPSANLPPMAPEEAMGILRNRVKLSQRGALKKMKVKSVDQYFAFKYILNRYVEVASYYSLH